MPGFSEQPKSNKPGDSRFKEGTDQGESRDLLDFTQKLVKEEFESEVKDTVISEATQKEARKEWEEARERGANEAAQAHDLIQVFEKEKEALEQLRNKFRGKIFIDIGAGSGREFFTDKPPIIGGHEVAKMLKSKGYIAVEPNFPKNLARTVKDRDQQIEGGLEIPIKIFADDGVSFLRKLQNSSACIFSAYLDKTRLPNPEYRDNLAKEVAGVVGDQNAFLEYMSAINPGNYLEKQVIKWDDPEELDQRKTKLWSGVRGG